MHFQPAFPYGLCIEDPEQRDFVDVLYDFIPGSTNKSSKSSIRSLDTTGQQPHTTTTQHHVIMS